MRRLLWRKMYERNEDLFQEGGLRPGRVVALHRHWRHRVARYSASVCLVEREGAGFIRLDVSGFSSGLPTLLGEWGGQRRPADRYGLQTTQGSVATDRGRAATTNFALCRLAGTEGIGC